MARAGKLKGRVAALVAAALMAIMLAGCASAASSPSGSSAAAQAEPAVAIGEKNDAIAAIPLKNGLGDDVNSVRVIEGDRVEELAIEGGIWEDGSEGELYVELKAASSCDISITCTEAVYTLHDVKLDELAQADGAITLAAQDGLAYLEYAANGETLSTLEDERALAAAALQAQAEAEAAAQAQAQAEAEAQAAAEAASSASETVYDEPVYTGNGGDSSSAGSAPAQSGDSCVDDVILR